MVVQNEQKMSVSDSDSLLPSNILLLSYNRPRMLREAISSIINQPCDNWTLWILDDGSDVFNPIDIVDEFEDDRIILVRFPQKTPKQRAAQSSVGYNINYILKDLPKNELVFYLCDDDLLAPNWVAMASKVLTNNPGVHVVQGETWTFWDGQTIEEAVPGLPYASTGIKFEKPMLWWSSGSFAHLTDCVFDEKLWWEDNKDGHSQDAFFILRLWSLHSNVSLINKPSYYRREHANTISAKLGKFNPDGTWKTQWDIPALLPSHIDGAME